MNWFDQIVSVVTVGQRVFSAAFMCNTWLLLQLLWVAPLSVCVYCEYNSCLPVCLVWICLLTCVFILLSVLILSFYFCLILSFFYIFYISFSSIFLFTFTSTFSFFVGFLIYIFIYFLHYLLLFSSSSSLSLSLSLNDACNFIFTHQWLNKD